MTDQLDRWGMIANHLGVSEKTATRYMKQRGLPVGKDPAGHPITTRQALDAWRFRNFPTTPAEGKR